MARTRSVKISESAEELDQLRQYYSGKPEGRRLLFLLLLKEDRTRTIAEAARKAKISARRGRYWWDAYRKGGLQNLLDRRVWKREELTAPVRLESVEGTKPDSEGNDGEDSRAWIAFLNAIASNSSEHEDVRNWISGFRSALMALLGDVDFIAMHIRTGINVVRVGKGKVQSYLEYGDDSTVSGHSVERSGSHKHYYESLMESGRKSGFPFEDYQDPPHGFDFFLEAGRRDQSDQSEDDTLVASLVLLRKKGNPPISLTSLNLVERLRPFLVYSVTDFLVRSALLSTKGFEIEPLVERVAGNASLTPQESRVLLLAFMGHSYQEIAESLFVSVSTVQTHVQAIYRKTGVSKLGEIYAKFLTNRKFPDESNDLV